jgi:hypothetical protein
MVKPIHEKVKAP